MKELKRKQVKNCPCCNNTSRYKSYTGWNKLTYHFCVECGSAYQDPRVFKREFPYWKTDYATVGNFFRLFMPWKISPQFYGNIMIFYAKKSKSHL